MATKPPPQYGMTIIMTGDITNGFRAVGPFKVPSAAIDWATDHCESQWEAIALEHPEGYVDGDN